MKEAKTYKHFPQKSAIFNLVKLLPIHLIDGALYRVLDALWRFIGGFD